jgi:hypothetical protein
MITEVVINSLNKRVKDIQPYLTLGKRFLRVFGIGRKSFAAKLHLLERAKALADEWDRDCEPSPAKRRKVLDAIDSARAILRKYK